MIARVETAAEQVKSLIQADIQRNNLPITLDPNSPDGDPGKFLLNGKVARVIHRRDGFYAKINLDWFIPQFNKPNINNTDFYWYVFALTRGHGNQATTYYVCDYLKMIEFVLDFEAPLGSDHQDHAMWNGTVHILDDDEESGYFFWRDEDRYPEKPHRYIPLKNIIDVLNLPDVKIPGINVFDDLTQARKTYQGLSETERQAIIKSRVGQGEFRESLFELWGGCSITQITNPDLLIASHIKPWRDSTNSERLDCYNGLLLLPNFDVLFDKGLISFQDNGMVLISPRLDDQTLATLGITPQIKLRKVLKQNSPYLQYHRENIYQS